MRYLIARGRRSLGAILGIHRYCQPTDAAHGCPVIFVDSSTNKAYLIVVAMNPAMRPGEPVGAQSFEEPLEEWSRHTVLILKSCELALHTGPLARNFERSKVSRPVWPTTYHGMSPTGSHPGSLGRG